MKLTRIEIDTMLRRADGARLKLRRATRELQRFGGQTLAARARDRAEHESAASRTEREQMHDRGDN